jgi:hypothetical protein
VYIESSICTPATAAKRVTNVAQRQTVAAPCCRLDLEPYWVAHAPSTLVRLFQDLEGLLQEPEILRDRLNQLCHRLVLGLQLHFATEESDEVAQKIEASAPQCQQALRECRLEHESLVDEAWQLYHVACAGIRCEAWQRQLNRAFRHLREAYCAHQTKEFQLLRSACGVDVRETD